MQATTTFSFCSFNETPVVVKNLDGGTRSHKISGQVVWSVLIACRTMRANSLPIGSDLRRLKRKTTLVQIIPVRQGARNHQMRYPPSRKLSHRTGFHYPMITAQ